MSNLKTNYKDAELSPSMNGKRQYELQYNEAGYTNLVDKTAYTEVGDTFGADDINATNSAVNELNQNLIEYANPNYELLFDVSSTGDKTVNLADYRYLVVCFYLNTENTLYNPTIYEKDLINSGFKLQYDIYAGSRKNMRFVKKNDTTINIDVCNKSGTEVFRFYGVK